MKAVAAVLLRFCSDLECDIALLGGARLSDRHAVTHLKTRVLKRMSDQLSSRIPENLMYFPFHLIRRVNKTTVFFAIILVFSFRGQRNEEQRENNVMERMCGLANLGVGVGVT